MAKEFVCEKCGGMPIRAETDDGLVQAVQSHMKDTHEMEMSGDMVLAMAQEGQDAKPWWKFW